MRIAMLLYPSPGGSGLLASQLAAHLALRGHRVHLFSTEAPFGAGRLGAAQAASLAFHRVEVPSYPVFAHPPYGLAMAAQVADLARSEGLDVVHAHYAVPHAAVAAAVREMVRPSAVVAVTTLHGTDVTVTGAHPALRTAVAFGLRACDGVTAVSRDLARRARETFRGVRPQVIPDFVDVRHFRPRPSPLRRQLAAPEEAVLVHASNFRAVKRPERTVEVLAQVLRHRPAVLVLCGDGPQVATTLERARALGVEGQVRFLGLQPDLAEVLAAADLFLLPSRQEGFGLAALEAMACGVPVVASRVGGLPEVLRDGREGFLTAPEDPEAMAQAVERALDPERLPRLRRAARARAVRRFSPSRVVPRYEALYRRLLARRAGGGRRRT